MLKKQNKQIIPFRVNFHLTNTTKLTERRQIDSGNILLQKFIWVNNNFIMILSNDIQWLGFENLLNI